jgi:ATP-dependent protease ClpP protease subunit
MKDWFSITNRSDKAAPAEVAIYGDIGGDWEGNGVIAGDFNEQMKSIPADKPIDLHIHSRGGSVWEGLAIFNTIAARRKFVTAHIDGVALSMASVIAMAAGKVVMPRTARMMIHDAQGLAMGDSEEMRKTADLLEKESDNIAQIYASKSGRPASEFRDLMRATTWMNGDEAKARGLVDEVIDTMALENKFDLSVFKNSAAPEVANNLTTAPAATAKPGSTVAAAGKPTTPQNKMSETATAPAASNPTAQNFDPKIITDMTTAIAALSTKVENMRPNTPPALGAEPLNGSHRVENLGNPLVERYNSLAHDKVAQSQLAKNLYNDVRKQLMIAAGCDPKILTPENRFDFNDPKIRNANTVDAALANTVLAADFVTTMRTYCAPWTAFTRRVEMSPVSKRQTLEVPLISSAGGMQTNATNYETGDTTLAPIPILTSEYSRSFHVTRPQTNLGLQLASLVPTNAKILGEGLSALFTAKMTNAIFGADVVIGVAADFSATDLPAILALGKNYAKCTLVLDGGHLAYLLPTSRESFVFGEAGAYGFDGGIYKNNLWTGGATDICGLVCGADAIVSAWGQADGLPAGEAIAQSMVEVMGFPFSSTVWFSRATREVWGSFQIVGGVKEGDQTQAEVLTTQ